MLGHEPIEITKQWLTFFLTLGLVGVLPARTAFAHDAPAIAPARLEFDASQAPKLCNDRATFRTLLDNWASAHVLTPDADRRLVVRIRRSPTGEKLVDVTLVDVAETTTAEHHERFGAREECHRVLYESARAAARLLGAFEKPPPSEPCPVCAACAACPDPEPAPSPTCPAVIPPAPRIEVPPPIVRRIDLGVGVLLGMGGMRAQWVGPLVSLGIVPSARVPHLRIEMDAAWAPRASPTSNALRGDMIPLFSSLCYVPSALRLCTGVVTTFLLSEPGNDLMHTTFATSLRLGAEFEIAGPASIRVDGFVLVPLGERTFGSELATRDAQDALMAGTSVTGVWSFE